ncbi:MAG TPA: DASS family sodium-coupled anion symporter [Sunxiuqinia sp.]|nr:DASS family sodium-coupled anion symporter [Sunxiuqinia sp.]
MKLTNRKIVAILAGPLAFLFILFFFHPKGLSLQANAVLASTVWMAIWWITEAISIFATALLPIILFPLTGGLALTKTTASFGHRYIFLFLGGFLVAIAIEKWNLHKRIALSIINLIGTNIKRIILGFMIATAFLSMWISNTATTVMMLPIGLAIVAQLKLSFGEDGIDSKLFAKALMLAIAYSASIGGMATLIGTPPNLVLAGVVQQTYGVEITFSQWLLFGLPISCLLLFISWKYLTNFAFQFQQKELPGGKQEIRKLLRELGKIRFEEKIVLVVFVVTAVLWISRSLIQKIIPAIDDTIIAMVAGLSLFLLPTKTKGKRIIDWGDAVKVHWGVLLLFGGGMALAEGFKVSGLAVWIAGHLTLLQSLTLLFLVAVLIASVNFLTEITSNLATTAMLLPIIASIALAIDVHPYLLMVSATIAASCAFMLPVATPPNAIVFGSGYLKIPDMVRTGIWMNLVSIVLLTIFVYFILPHLWGFDPSVFPVSLK